MKNNFYTADNMEKIKNNNAENYFIGVTYKIVPGKKEWYKLISITGVKNKSNSSFILALVLIKFEDTNSFYYSFKYINTMLKFKPKVAYIDYFNSLKNEFLIPGLFKVKPMIIAINYK